MFTTSIFTHYKTTVAGLVAIVTVVGKIVATGQVDLTTDIAAIAAAVGLIVAHDPK